MPTLYALRRQLRQCVDCGQPAPRTARCPRHQQQNRLAARAHAASAALPGPPLLACCGQWHTVTALPVVCPACQTRYLEEIPAC